MPIKALEAPRVRGIFIDYQKKIGSDRKREADNRLTVLSLIFGHAKNMGKIQNNPIQNFDRIYWADRSDIIWTQADIQRFMDSVVVQFSPVLKRYRSNLLCSVISGILQPCL